QIDFGIEDKRDLHLPPGLSIADEEFFERFLGRVDLRLGTLPPSQSLDPEIEPAEFVIQLVDDRIVDDDVAVAVPADAVSASQVRRTGTQVDPHFEVPGLIERRVDHHTLVRLVGSIESIPKPHLDLVDRACAGALERPRTYLDAIPAVLDLA